MKNKKLKIFLIILFVLFILGLILVLGINWYVLSTTKKQIVSVDNKLNDIDCIVVLGAKVKSDNNPSPMLNDRLEVAIDLYKKKIAPKIIMSGDHGQKNYDEVNVMKNFAIDKGIPSDDIFMDHAGFSTYESIYRAKEIFKAKKIIIVTQKYHLYRALYIANCLGIEAYGIAADIRKYAGQSYRELREILARDKDFVKCIFKVKPKYLGEEIPVSGNGDITNDK